MPTLDTHTPGLRVLIVGDPGSGKSGAILKLAEAGQRLFVCDFDKNLTPLMPFIKPEARKLIHFETLVDPVSFDINGRPVTKGIPPAFHKFTKLSANWVDSETGEDFGAPESWGWGSWFVIDGATWLGLATMNYTKFKRQTMGKARSKATWGEAIERVEGSIAKFVGAPINFIVSAHLARLHMEDITETADDEGKPLDKPIVTQRLPPNANMRYPVTLGQKLPTTFGGMFNLILQVQRQGSGVGARRLIRTVPEEDVDIKVPLPPKTVPPEVSIDKLWDILKHFSGG